MKFSVIIPLYNKQASVRRALSSVFDQVSNSEIEYQVIVIDDGSTDGSLAVVNSIQREHAEHEIIVHSQANAGVSAARNKGIELSSAEYIAFLDADDTYEPNFLSEIDCLISHFPCAGLYATKYRFIDTVAGSRQNARFAGANAEAEHHLLEDYFYSSAYGDLPVTSSSVCIRKNALASIGGFPVGENMGEDQAVWSQIALNYSIALSQKVCANYFLDTANSLMNEVAPSDEMPFSKRLQQQLNLNQVPENLRASIEKYIAGHLLDLVRRNIQAGDTRRARVFSADSRARRQFKRWVYWSVRLKIATVVSN